MLQLEHARSRMACRAREGTLGLEWLRSRRCGSCAVVLRFGPSPSVKPSDSTASLRVSPAMFENQKKANSEPPRVSPQERRVHPRYPFSAAAETVYADTRLMGRTSDLSKGGCYVDTISPFPLGVEVRIRISRGNLTFVAQARVMYAAAGMGMGLMFTKIEPDRLQVLQEWLGELSGESPAAQPQMLESSGPGQRAGSANNNEQQYVLNELIIALMRKQVLTDAEGKAMLKKLIN